MIQWAEFEMNNYYNETGDIEPPTAVNYRYNGKTYKGKLSENDRGIVVDLWRYLSDEPCATSEDFMLMNDYAEMDSND